MDEEDGDEEDGDEEERRVDMAWTYFSLLSSLSSDRHIASYVPLSNTTYNMIDIDISIYNEYSVNSEEKNRVEYQ